MLAMAESRLLSVPASRICVPPAAVHQECQPQSIPSFMPSPQVQSKTGVSLVYRSSFCGRKLADQSVRRLKGLATDKESAAARAEAEVSGPSGRIIKGPCFVVEDNIDTDQIIPAEYLTLVPSKPDEYEKLGSYAMVGLPAKYGRYIEEGEMKTKYPIMIGGNNFGCGSSREHAPVAMGAAGCKAVVAPSFARIYFRNCVATGELYPVESEVRLCDQFTTGDEVTVDMEHDFVINHTTGKQYTLKPIGEAGPVIDAGGIFNYARSTGMIAAK
eukprot:TRINITY_DN23680_c0_g1_i1.p1 TRINITY_DN23680_c0_g1~~TRINITY_DN23680_c0_g1_i1.p1  ORF type:complete len:272 (+),score=43.00 TRINITY_DN23680_c0_g1_i1:55-870(+)